VIQNNGNYMMTIAPAPQISAELSEKAQKLALDLAAEVGAVGVMAVEMFVQDQKLSVGNLVMCPHVSGNWTIRN
jgi:5-(carboxyamino)imidazole ribonucleotide synthase